MSTPEVLRPQYLRVRNWEKHQHYKNRRPPWIKYHVESLNDYELVQLPVATRLLYKELLLVAAITDNNIPHDPAWIASETHLKQAVVIEGVENLVVAGFLTVTGSKRSASKALARRERDASPRALARGRGREETETEEESAVKESSKGSGVVRPPAVRALPLNEDKEVNVGKLLELIGSAGDDGTEGVVRSLAKKLNAGGLAKVAESVAGGNTRTDRASHVVGALQNELTEQKDAQHPETRRPTTPPPDQRSAA